MRACYLDLRNSLKKTCKHPLYIRGSRLFIHPKDLCRLSSSINFIDACAFYKITYEQGCVGAYRGFRVFIQDDMMRLILALAGEKDWDPNES